MLEEVDIFVTTTGNKGIISVAHMQKMKNNVIVGNMGNFDNEIDILELKSYPGVKRIEIKPQTDRWVFPDGHGIIVLADGNLLNLGCSTGHPSFVMSNSFSNQIMAQISLHDPSSGYKKGVVYALPKHLDEEVARLHLASLGAELTDLTQE